MKFNLFLIACIIFASCSNQQKDKAFVIKILTSDTIINVHKIKPDAYFSKKFIYYLIEKFPTASNVIFSPNNSSEFDIKLSDSTYEYGIIAGRNRIFLIN